MPGTGAAALARALLALALLVLPPAASQPHGTVWLEEEAQFDTTYANWVSTDRVHVYAFNHSVLRNQVSPAGGCPLPPPRPRPPPAPRSRALGLRRLPAVPAAGGILCRGGRAKSSPPRPVLPANAAPPRSPRRRRACGCR